MSVIARPALVLLGALGAGACGAGWRRSDLQPGALKPRQQVQLWRGGSATRWHAVVIAHDTISAIPFTRPSACDSCRVRFPRAEVDSIRLGNPVAGFWKTLGLVVAVPLAVILGVCIETGSWPECFPTGGS